MDGILIIVFAVATFANITIVYFKLRHNQIQNAIVDLSVLIALTYVFGGSTAGLAIATLTSAMFSIYLFFDPPEINLPSRKNKKNWRHSRNL